MAPSGESNLKPARTDEGLPRCHNEGAGHVIDCRREDSNLHSLNGNQVLNLVSAYCTHISLG